MGERAAIYLVLDRSGSMRKYYSDGTVQYLAERVLGLSRTLDDDGSVPVTFFSTDVDGTTAVSVDNYVLWEVTHPDWMKMFWETRKLARTTAIGELRLSHLKLEQRKIRGHVLNVFD
ncbi:VWA domain-containing protein [Streptomyces sp. NPDC005562]|uniref:VWA domain-containing protein n=1 Tax=Streptomyces sp. NPDC005562 TaxID=3154890 RepID=UPI0033A4D02A